MKDRTRVAGLLSARHMRVSAETTALLNGDRPSLASGGGLRSSNFTEFSEVPPISPAPLHFSWRIPPSPNATGLPDPLRCSTSICRQRPLNRPQDSPHSPLHIEPSVRHTGSHRPRGRAVDGKSPLDLLAAGVWAGWQCCTPSMRPPNRTEPLPP